MSPLRSIAAILTLGAVACTVSGARVQPKIPLPARFSSAGDRALADRWWLDFDDPVLTSLVDQGLAANPGLLGTWARLDEAQASVRGSRASLYPSIDASAGAGANVRGSGASGSLSLGVSASYEVDLWGRVAATRDATALEAEATEMDLRAAAISLSAEIATTWYQLVASRAGHELLQRQLELAERSLDLTRQRFERGLVAEVDVLGQEQNVESLRASQVSADKDVALLEHRLAVLLGRPPTERVAPDVSTLAALPPLPAAGVPSELLLRRPDLVASLLRVQAADRSVAAAIAARYPRLSLGLDLSTGLGAAGGLLDSWAGSLVANLVAPLFDGGQRRADADRARAQLRERVQGYAGTVLSALAEVEAQGRASLASVERQLALASQVLAHVQDAYAAGASDYLKVLDATRSVQALERQRLEAQSALLQNRIALCRALAGTWTLARPEAAS